MTRTERVFGRWTPAAPGPTLICVAGVHGNEWAGLHAARRVLEHLATLPSDIGRGEFLAVAGNLAALNHENPDVRYLDHDLNRAFTPERIARAAALPDEDLTVEEREMLEIRRFLREHVRPRKTFLLDLHTVSAPSPPFLFLEDSLVARAFGLAFGVPVILGVEEEVTGLLIDHASNEWGVVSVVIEAGRHDDPRSIDLHTAAIWRALHHLEMCPPEHAPCAEPPEETLARAAGRRAEHIYDVHHREPIEHPDFQIIPEIQNFDTVHHHESLVAIQRGRRIYAPTSGRVFMPNRQPIKRPGDDGFFIVRRVHRPWLRLSARLRTWPPLHRLLPRLAPGVRRHPERPDALLVDAFYAPVFKRQIFHLLGYRILGHGREIHLPPWRRVVRGTLGLCAAIVAMLRGMLRGGEPAILREPTERDWIVARRTLDRVPPPTCGKGSGEGFSRT